MTACGKCFTCFGCCGLCSSGRRRKDPEYHPMPPTPTPYQGYQPQPMMYNHNGPQFATFDAGTKSVKIHEDSLPHMPSWDNAATRRVEDHSQPRNSEMEMERMLPQSPVREQPYHQPQPYSSTIQEQPYGQPQPYSSDLGTQRLDQRSDAHGFYDTPLSPAPTYYSNPPAAGALAPSNSDRFYPQQHYHNTSYERSFSPGLAPYPSSRESTQFTYDSYQSQQNEGQTEGGRPPSFPQVGRKPVAGSYREV